MPTVCSTSVSNNHDLFFEITISSDCHATGHGPETFNHLLCGFTVDNTEYIAASVSIHNYNNGKVNKIYSHCANDSAAQPLRSFVQIQSTMAF